MGHSMWNLFGPLLVSAGVSRWTGRSPCPLEGQSKGGLEQSLYAVGT